MPSPFPGVDPFIEGQGVWHDFHQTFVITWREFLMRRLPPQYVARVEEHVYVNRAEAESAGRVTTRIPDVLIEASGVARGEADAEDDGPVVTLVPTVMRHVVDDPLREGYIEIKRRADDGVVGVLELLSPVNKTGAGRDEYLVKRGELLARRVHLVELDLLLRGPRFPFEGRFPDGHYHAMVSRGDRRPDCEIYSWKLPDRLPVIPVPLGPDDPDLPVDLHAVFETTFDRGVYDRLVRYDRPVGLRLDEPLRRWVDERAAVRTTR
ncbi:MAG: DUF4058 family protein [Phycisphaerae bacterium]|nr:DUF4058 family protein [Tepidisphaeraceae bacterium]